MTVTDLKNYVRKIEVDLSDELGAPVSITIREPDSFQYLEMQKAAKESEEKAFHWVADNLGSLIVGHTFEGVNDVNELAAELSKQLPILLKITAGISDFLGQSNPKQKKQKK